MNNTENILELSGITKIYPGVVALDNVSMNVKRGEVHGLIGENGAGKSTLIKTLAGAHKPNSGKIIYDNNEYEYFLPHEAMNLKIACIYQELNQVPYMSVMENIFLGRELYKKNGFLDLKTMEKETKDVLREFELDINPHTQLGLLGVGTRQMVEICKAAHANSKLLIMDEPTAALSEKETKELFKIIAKLKEKGVTMIYISHRLEEVQYACDTLTVLRDGQVVIDGANVKDTTVDDMVSYMVGHDIKQKYPKKEFKIGEKVLEVKNLTRKGYFSDVSFSVRTGEILGFAGLVGAGRTEVMRALTGADPLDSGEILIDGKPVKINNPKDSIENGIAFLTEDRKGQGLILLQSVEFNTTLVTLKSFKQKGFINLQKMNEESERLVKNLRIKVPHVHTLAGALSGGNQQKVVLAKWLISKAKIFIIDEPTRGIDVGAKIEVYNLINELLDHGAAVIMVSSEMDECMGISDRIVVMHEGEKMGEIMRPDFTQEKIMYAASGIKIDE